MMKNWAMTEKECPADYSVKFCGGVQTLLLKGESLVEICRFRLWQLSE